ncbi:MAG: pyruvate kinase [Planctomycetales bacterium]|nr:pyruvate kinase [Planctomycetales bacterium]
MKPPRPYTTEARSKIVATIGPASREMETLVELVEAGVDVFRINAAHGCQADFDELLSRIRKVREITGYAVAVLLDLAGPKIRLGQLKDEALQVEIGDELVFIRGDECQQPQELCSTYPRLVDEVSVDDQIMLADGTISLQAISKNTDSVRCKVLTSGIIRSRQGINLPGVKLSVTAMRKEDVDNAIWAAKNDIDFISLSFVRTAQDVASLKNLLTSLESAALVIAKIEKREALDQLEDIVRAADGVMVARGDLGVEIDVAQTPVAQKRIIQVCREQLKPVIVATQMLESMHANRRPTRAEASDVANAVLDGADACMLSGETAIGQFPVDAVSTMNRIMLYAEQLIPAEPSRLRVAHLEQVHPITAAVTYNASSIAESIGAKLVVVASRSGGTAWVKSKQRSVIPTLGISDNPVALRRMSLFWGIMPLKVDAIEGPQQLMDVVTAWGRNNKMLLPGDRVVFVTGTGVLENAHNTLVAFEVPA